MYLIVSPRVEPSDFSNQTEQLDDLALDYTDLLRLTLQVWPAIDDRDDDELKLAIEAYLANHAIRRIHNYADMQQAVMELLNPVRTFHEGMRGQLTPLIEEFGWDVRLYFTRFLHKDLLLRLELPRYETR